MLFVKFVPAYPWLLVLLLTVRNGLLGDLGSRFRVPLLLQVGNILCDLVGLGLMTVYKECNFAGLFTHVGVRTECCFYRASI
jgi:hypothetical protein